MNISKDEARIILNLALGNHVVLNQDSEIERSDVDFELDTNECNLIRHIRDEFPELEIECDEILKESNKKKAIPLQDMDLL